MNAHLNGPIMKVIAHLATAGIIGLIVLYGTQKGLARDVEGNKKCCEKTRDNAIAIGKIVQWIEIARQRTEREHQENRSAHQQILEKLDEIKDDRK